MRTPEWNPDRALASPTPTSDWSRDNEDSPVVARLLLLQDIDEVNEALPSPSSDEHIIATG
jgi:hypothetical protein